MMVMILMIMMIKMVKLHSIDLNFEEKFARPDTRNYDMIMLGMSDTRWTGYGQRRLTAGELLLFSGHEEDNAPHTQGVTLILPKTSQRVLIRWEAHRPRILKATFQAKRRMINIDVIQCYA